MWPVNNISDKISDLVNKYYDAVVAFDNYYGNDPIEISRYRENISEALKNLNDALDAEKA